MSRDFPVMALCNGAIEVPRSEHAIRFDTLLSCLLPLEIRLFRMHASYPQPAALIDDTPVFGAFCIGDLLSRKLDLPVPQGAVVLIRHDAAFLNASFELGVAIAEILTAIMMRAFRPMPEETEIFAVMARNSLDAAEKAADWDKRFSVERFRDGLMETLVRTGHLTVSHGGVTALAGAQVHRRAGR